MTGAEPHRRVLVVGGVTGIGRAAFDAFRAAGDDVALFDLDGEGALAAASGHAPGRAIAMGGDIAAPGAAADAVARAVAAFGGLDTVLVTAGVLQSAPLADWTPALWERSLAVNLTAPFFVAQSAAPHLARSDNASLLLTSSTGALRGHAGMPAYHATKSGLMGLARALADELGPAGTRVNCLLPGWIETPFNAPFWSFQAEPDAARRALESGIPLRRQGQPADVAGAILFLASSAARYVTGASLVVDGGYSAV